MTTEAICSEMEDSNSGLKNWRYEAEKLNDVAELKRIMDINIKRTPSFHRKRMRLLDDFFQSHPSPVDIVIVLYGALFDAHILAYHLEGNNLLFYRPKTSYKWVVKAPFLEGDVHPDRTLLIFDSDMVSGDAMTETADHLTRLGYDRSKVFGYLDGGCKWRGYKAPELMQVDDLLKK